MGNLRYGKKQKIPPHLKSLFVVMKFFFLNGQIQKLTSTSQAAFTRFSAEADAFVSIHSNLCCSAALKGVKSVPNPNLDFLYLHRLLCVRNE